MKAVRENKEYTITEDLKRYYKDSGFDIYDDAGNIVEYSRGKTVSIEEHIKALDRIAELEEQIKAFEKSDSKSEREGKK